MTGQNPRSATNGLAAAVRRHRTAANWAAALVPAYLLVYPLTDYQLFQLSRVTTTALAVASLVLLTGRSGQVSAGQGAAFGLGAYTCAVLVVQAGVPWPLAVVGAVLLTFAAGLLLGLPAQRLGPLSLALVTLTVAVLLPLLAARLTLTGGPFGLVLPPVRTPAGIQLSSAQFLYLVTLAALAGTIALVSWWTRGRVGRALVALRTNPLMARTNGVDTARLSVLVVGISAAMAGLGGALGALVLGSAIPDSYSFVVSLALLTGAVVGGIRCWAGAVIGAAYVVYLPQLASDVAGSSGAPWSQVIYAATLLGALYFAPTGLAGLASRFRRARTTRTEMHREPLHPTQPASRMESHA